MRAFRFMRRLIGLVPRDKESSHVEPSKPWPRTTVPPTLEEVDTQMKFSAAMSKCLDQGMSYDEAKDYIEACADDIKAGLQTPWRRKLGENRYAGSCGCIFNGDGVRVIPCRDHK